jgi:WD40 repeat protein
MLRARVSRLNKRIDDFGATLLSRPPQDYDEEADRIQEAREKSFLVILRDTSSLIREAEDWESPHLPLLIDAAHKILNKGTGFASLFQTFDFMPSWAHDNERDQPLIGDSTSKLGTGKLIGTLTEALPTEKLGKLTPDPWKATTMRHPKSSRLVRFRPGLPALTPTSTNPLAMSVYDARCEVSSLRITTPIKFRMSQGSSVLALNSMNGFKNRSPGLWYFLLESEKEPLGFLDGRFLEPGLCGIAYDMAIDESRHLIFVGDEDRVKSYEWMSPSGECYDNGPFPVHTLNSGRTNGPLTVLPNGTIIRAGRGSAAVWNIDGLQTHGENGDDRIGKKINVENTSRDELDEIEPSSGSLPNSHIEFVDQQNLAPGIWQPLTSSPTTMICSMSSKGMPDFSCVVLDLETGKTLSRYLGHGGNINDFSVSATDPQVFLSACDDGFARLFDLRHPLPVLTFDACNRKERCKAAALAHPDGIPSEYFWRVVCPSF